MDNEFAFETRMGWVVLTWTGAGLRTLGLSGEAPAAPLSRPLPPWVAGAVDLIRRHLAGEAADLAAIPVDLEGLPPFRRKVLEVLRATRAGGHRVLVIDNRTTGGGGQLLLVAHGVAPWQK